MGFKDSPNALRILELVLVTSVAFAGPLYGSFYYFFFGLGGATNAGQHVYGLITEILAISVLVYVLFRQGRHLSDLGFDFHWRDIPRAIAIATIGYGAFYVSYVAVYYAC